MQAREHGSLASNRDGPPFDILARLDNVERQLRDTLQLAQAGCLGCQQALEAIAALRARISPVVPDTHAFSEPARKPGGQSRRVWLVDVDAPADEPFGQLSPREIEVLALIADGHSNKEIAVQLVLSVRTVERHINNIYRKIDAQNKADATAYALRHNLA
jgi:DNA-binding NarL/FixJ family response regulator